MINAGCYVLHIQCDLCRRQDVFTGPNAYQSRRAAGAAGWRRAIHAIELSQPETFCPVCIKRERRLPVPPDNLIKV